MHLHFLSGIPRSGSTLLAALLNQRDDVYVSSTSSLGEVMGAAITTWEQNLATKAAGGVLDDGIRMLRGIAEAHYAARAEPVILDKGRGWPAPQIMATMEKVLGGEEAGGGVKIVATVRPVADCLASFVKIAQPENVADFCKHSELAKHLFASYQILKSGYEARPENFCFVEYDDLVTDPQRELDRVADFLGIDRHACDPEHVQDSGEDDTAWNIPGLHAVRPKVAKRDYSPREVLGDKLYAFYQGGAFWRSEPEPVRPPAILDLSLAAALRGQIDTAWELLEQLRIADPEDNRAAFNRGWHFLRQGKFTEGNAHLLRGREEGVFGNPHPGTGAPIWDGARGETVDTTVLLSLEGGLGDQLHGARFVRDITATGARAVVACSAELAPVIKDVEGVSAVCQHEALRGVYHEAWLPSMSAPYYLGHRRATGTPYIVRTTATVPGRIGIRWRGNPRFEHEQHRVFPSELLFGAVAGMSEDVISLQRDEGAAERPHWAQEVNLADWRATRDAVSSCELVITSCTSIAHLAGAMGVETWVVVPILPYYLWAYPGEKTDHYDSVTLFRQEQYGDWAAPFAEIKKRLENRKTQR